MKPESPKRRLVSELSVIQKTLAAEWTLPIPSAGNIARLLANGVEISFAYTSFKWSNSAKQNAGVTCAIIGLRPVQNAPKWIFAQGMKAAAHNINPYLAKGSNTIIGRRPTPLSDLPPAVMGSMARDGGNLILDKQEREELLRQYPHAGQLVRRLVGAQEFIKSEFRWCLWIEADSLELAKSIPPVADRIAEVYKFRVASTANTTKGYASIPHQFAQRAHRNTESILIPCHSSELREYIPMGYLGREEIIPNSALAVYNARPWLFAVVSSRMHMVWVRATAGRLEERIRYSASICYNNFPFPSLGASEGNALDECAHGILTAREAHFPKSIAAIYDPVDMPDDLRQAHAILDSTVERCYRPKPFANDEERLEFLFALYDQTAGREHAPIPTQEESNVLIGR